MSYLNPQYVPCSRIQACPLQAHGLDALHRKSICFVLITHGFLVSVSSNLHLNPNQVVDHQLVYFTLVNNLLLLQRTSWLRVQTMHRVNVVVLDADCNHGSEHPYPDSFSRILTIELPVFFLLIIWSCLQDLFCCTMKLARGSVLSMPNLVLFSFYSTFN